MKKLDDVGVLVARILMPVLFITAGWGKITGYAGLSSIWKRWAYRVSCCH